MNRVHLWLRAETKPQEQRAALTPKGAKYLISQGFKISVEVCKQRIFLLSHYQDVGCDIVPSGSWINAPESAFILGLKELPENDFPLIHRHIYFAHAYKAQAGASELLSRFVKGGGGLYDLEYLVETNSRRVAAFGYWAGFAGAALSLLAWANQQLKQPTLSAISSFNNQQTLVNFIKASLSKVEGLPKIMVIGAKGRSGSGAIALAELFGLKTLAWDLEETKRGGPFSEINDTDILVNCVMVNQDLPPFVTLSSLNDHPRKISVIADVSCDPYGSYNPIPLYQHCTTFEKPYVRVLTDSPELDLIAIDHLPSLLPKESSEDYEQQLLPYLQQLSDLSEPVWANALSLFHQKCHLIVGETTLEKTGHNNNIQEVNL
ncbi:saccharopine dehydrogenase [Thalassotalea profundi]|uniref:Saccharopine dehydrogenase [NAD(+), L-lysine-forming] n=1 Tax=Thalassotalea profundi TaxID=2036687 RepID=A0ABQ3IK28_9GAMM|nr:saccharopine dehydrogenase [Thalassotalea profundi]GHE86912.1 saccharopine dehydrogenase [Thalassotalea profundi]